MSKIKLFEAFAWICLGCNHLNFTDGVIGVDGNYEVDDEGRLVPPEKVECDFCCSEYET
jgi:hypothetical protein